MMEIVIKISEEEYNLMKVRVCKSNSDYLILDGTPLPKGHGDLVDKDAVNSKFYDIWQELASYSNKPSHKELLDKWSMCMDTAPTIIEADKESES